ncbi:hypothetical protein MUK60_07520 [Streptomyces sp. LRE541]|uniref:hypothetical protein n=1 Tax=Streptomyces sp. LRE541 TaxID=2931983 RepID=UPI00200EEB65|nr:hypothetical protein [Streptomyces sp. LRE541]UPZ27682.1 hypothetical protein MUK60_07520 [Streptomyces sp. LRE541]
MTDRTVHDASTGTGLLDAPLHPTAPLPAAAVEALSRLERAFPPAEIVAAVSRFEAAAARFDELVAKPFDSMTAAEVEAYTDSQQVMADAFAVLAEAGRTDLLAPLQTADRYRLTDEHRREMATHADTLCGSDFDRMLCDIDEMGHCRTVLAKAGRLDLIGGGR